MSESGKNIVDGFRVLRRFCKDVSLMLISFCCGRDLGSGAGRAGLNKKDASLSFG